MKRKPYVAPFSEKMMLELCSLMVQSITEDNNADAKQDDFNFDEEESSSGLWDRDYFK